METFYRGIHYATCGLCCGSYAHEEPGQEAALSYGEIQSLLLRTPTHGRNHKRRGESGKRAPSKEVRVPNNQCSET